MVQLLRDLVALGKGSRTGGANERADFLKTRLQKAGFDVELDRVPLSWKEKKTTAKNLVAKREVKGAPTLFLYGHLDTVEPAEGWKTDPYTLVEKGRKLYGLGAIDMLSGITAFMEAVQAPSKYGIVFLGTCDEENDSEGVLHFIAHRKKLLAKADLILSGDATDIFPRNSKPTQLPHSILAGNPAYACAEFIISPKKGKQNLNPLDVLDIVMKEVKIIIDAFPNRSKSPLMKDRANLCDICAETPDGMPFPKTVKVDISIFLGLEATVKRLESTRTELEAKLLQKPAIKKITKRGFDVNLAFCDDPVAPIEGFLVTDFSDPLVSSLTRTINDVVGVRRIRTVGGTWIGDENFLATTLTEMGCDIPIIGYTAAGGNEHKADEYVCSSSFAQVKEVYRRMLAR